MSGGESTEEANKQPNRPMTSQFIKQTNQKEKEKEASKLKIDKRTNKTNKQTNTTQPRQIYKLKQTYGEKARMEKGMKEEKIKR